jgi:hypothetical protein
MSGVGTVPGAGVGDVGALAFALVEAPATSVFFGAGSVLDEEDVEHAINGSVTSTPLNTRIPPRVVREKNM